MDMQGMCGEKQMTAAAIAAQLVDMRNVGTHKVLKLTIHVPEEQALQAIAAFGWPTGVNPVPIALARMNDPGAAAEQTLAPSTKAVASPASAVHVPNKELDSPDRGHTKTAFRDMRPANQAGILCDTPAFWKFLGEKQNTSVNDAEHAAELVRWYCGGLKSRSDIRPRTPSGDRWRKLFDEYQLWMHAPELVA